LTTLANKTFNLIGKSINDGFEKWQQNFPIQPVKKEFHLEKTATGWELTFLVPGFDKEEIGLQVKGSYVEVTASTTRKSSGELFSTSFYKNVLVGDIDEEAVQAELKNGVLLVILPSKERKNKITIK
jgi:HSP20 family molecular chaperone IbpA